MRSDGALEPRHGAATLQGRHIAVAKYRREARVKTCETQQQQCADEDDEAAAAATATARDASNNKNNNCRWTASEQQARPQPTSQAPGTTTTTITAATAIANKAKLHLSIKGAATATTTGTGTGRPSVGSPKMREEPSLMLMEHRVGGGGGASRGHSMVRRLSTYILCLISVVALLPLPLTLPLVQADDGDNFFAVNSFSVGPETTTPEFDYASRGQKKFGDKCENTLECGFPGSICDPKKKSCQCTEDLPVTNHIDKCGKAAAINESCFFNEQCEAVYFQTECRDGRCICRFEMSPIWAKDGSVECKGRQDKRGPETYIDPAMIGVLVGMALMFIIICVVLRLFSQ